MKRARIAVLVQLTRFALLGAVSVVSVTHAAQGEHAPDKVFIESHSCSCEDKPIAHFPYNVVILKSSQGEVVARPEGQESAVRFTPIALRYGERYCPLEADAQCYGSFAHPCEFTDFRYGPTLSQYFPTCKAP